MNPKNKKSIAAVIAIVFILGDFFIWQEIFASAPVPFARDYFLDVGQGDSELVIFPGNIKVMTDAGPVAPYVQVKPVQNRRGSGFDWSPDCPGRNNPPITTFRGLTAPRSRPT